MLRYDLPAEVTASTLPKQARTALPRRTKLLVAMAVVMPVLSMLAGAALAASRHGAL